MTNPKINLIISPKKRRVNVCLKIILMPVFDIGVYEMVKSLWVEVEKRFKTHFQK